MAEDATPPRMPEDWKRDLLKAAGERNRRALDDVRDELKTMLTAHHSDIMAAIGKAAAQVEVHNKWIEARDAAQAVLDAERAEAAREKNEQAMKQAWLADQAAQLAADRKARHERRAPYVLTFVGASATALFALILYAIDNLDHLRWGAQTAAITVVILLLSVSLMVLFRLNL